MSVTLVSGVPGVGASRVCEGARRELGEAYTLINTGDVMLEAALERNLAADREELSALPLGEQRLLQRRAGEYVRRAAADGPVIANTHLAVRTDHGFAPGLPGPVLSDVNPDAIVVVEAEPSTIVERRRESEYRDYHEEDQLVIEFHQQLSRAAAMGYSIRSDTPVRPIPNEGALEDAVEALVAVVEATASR